MELPEYVGYVNYKHICHNKLTIAVWIKTRGIVLLSVTFSKVKGLPLHPQASSSIPILSSAKSSNSYFVHLPLCPFLLCLLPFYLFSIRPFWSHFVHTHFIYSHSVPSSPILSTPILSIPTRVPSSPILSTPILSIPTLSLLVPFCPHPLYLFPHCPF